MAERPKRRKHKDNPYTLEFIEEKNSYRVSFKDVKGKFRRVDVNKEIYQAFDRFELDDLSELNEFDNHIEHSEVYENNLNERAMDKPLGVDEIVETMLINEELKKAINQLSEVQKRRIKMYYFEDMTLEDIARVEKTSHQAISKSIIKALAELRKILKK
ncbi:MAG: sigma-70 family RNA polymerase sigma factor [Firmicutes bacterium]|nr:sigma-70 family RNA polymerase sigma factor [Bacillota bacterium]